MTEALIEVDKTYHFASSKQLSPVDVPGVAHDLVERLDAEYERSRPQHFQKIVDASRPPVRAGGAPYAIFQDRDSSLETALVASLPYCNPIIPDTMDIVGVARAIKCGETKAFDSNTWNNGEKHLFLFEMMKALGVRDREGRSIPVIAIGSDSQDYQPKLDRQGKKALRHGDFGVYARDIEDILSYTGHGRPHFSGYSEGANVIHEFLARAGNFDVAGAILAEPLAYKERSVAALFENYVLNKPVPGNKPDSKPEIKWTADGPLSRKELEKIQNKSVATMFRAIALGGAWRAALGMTRATMIPDLTIAASKRGLFPLTISWNETSSLTHDIEQRLFAPGSHDKEVLDDFRAAGKLRLVKALGHEAVGAPHLAGESPMYYALMIGQSVLWAQTEAQAA